MEASRGPASILVKLASLGHSSCLIDMVGGKTDTEQWPLLLKILITLPAIIYFISSIIAYSHTISLGTYHELGILPRALHILSHLGLKTSFEGGPIVISLLQMQNSTQRG